MSRPFAGSLSKTQLCGLSEQGGGTFTPVAIEKLCEVLPNTRISTLRCAAC